MMLVMLELLAVTTVVALLVGPSPLPQGQLEQPHSEGEEGITGGVTGDGTGQGPEPQGVGVGGLTGVGAGEQVSQGVQMVQGSGVTTAAGAEARSRVSWCAANCCWPLQAASVVGSMAGRKRSAKATSPKRLVPGPRGGAAHSPASQLTCTSALAMAVAVASATVVLTLDTKSWESAPFEEQTLV